MRREIEFWEVSRIGVHDVNFPKHYVINRINNYVTKINFVAGWW